MRRQHRVLAPLLVLALASACGGGGSNPAADAGVLLESDVELQSFHLVNQARSGEAVEPQLGLDPAVCEVARRHSEAMRDEGFFSHTAADGQGLRQRLNRAGIAYSAAAENLAEVHHATRPAEVAHSQLMSSASHRKNILSPKYKLAGVGVAKAGDTYWITQVFIKP
ncbi:MAG: CAP domain-containing protein [Acidobacteriota bacterium]|nr:CAP domain-containing protein [Acidobacteriota bacterium]